MGETAKGRMGDAMTKAPDLVGHIGRCHGVVRLPDQQQPDKQ